MAMSSASVIGDVISRLAMLSEVQHSIGSYVAASMYGERVPSRSSYE